MSRLLYLVLLGGLLPACYPWSGIVPSGATQSLGTTSRGILVSPDHLEKRGPNHKSYKALDRRYASRELTGLILRSSKKVAQEHPGTVTLIGDLSGPGGGFISDHRSHRSGRDGDFAFFVTRPDGSSAYGWPLTKFDRFGVGLREKSGAVTFDTARNWSLVEAMLTDDEAEVQWIFVSLGLKARMIQWALDRGRDPEIIERAATVLHQPGDSAPHDDHFHVRIFCPDGDRGAHCQDRGKRRSWDAANSPEKAQVMGDEALLKLALDGLEG